MELIKQRLLNAIANTRDLLGPDHLNRESGSYVRCINKERSMPSYDNMLHEHITNDDIEVFNATKHVESKGAAAPGCEYFLFNLSDDFLGYIGVTTLGKLHNEHKMRGVIAKRASHQDDDGRWELVSSAVAPIKTKDIYIILGPHPIEGDEDPVEVIYTWHPGLPTPMPKGNGITDSTTVKLMGREDAFSHLSSPIRLQSEKKTPTFEEWIDSPEIRKEGEMWGKMAEKAGFFKDEDGNISVDKLDKEEE